MAGNDQCSQGIVVYAIGFRVPARGFRRAYIGEKEDEDGGDLLTTHVGQTVIACL